MSAPEDGSRGAPPVGERTDDGHSATSKDRARTERVLDEKSQTSIEEHLRTMFDSVAQEPVPDRFLDLLNQLETSEGPSKDGVT